MSFLSQICWSRHTQSLSSQQFIEIYVWWLLKPTWNLCSGRAVQKNYIVVEYSLYVFVAHTALHYICDQRTLMFKVRD